MRNSEQCQLVLALYHCTNDDDYQAMGIQLSRSIDNANVSPIIFSQVKINGY
ncbi:hypothetical protein J4731_20595 [Providencia rettgeri]|nr:hypothetical protein [Providencia rettgeri]